MKYAIAFLAALVLLALLFPRLFRRVLRALGRLVGDVGRAGQELATGDEVENSPLARYEVKAGELVAARLLAGRPLHPDPGLQELVRGLGAALARNAARREIPYRFSVVEGPEPNAFAVPGGSIFITRPLIDLAEGSPDRIACVLAHEVVHVDRRHAVKTLAASAAIRAGVQIATLGRAALLARISRGMEDLLVSGYRQDQELEADALGVRLAAASGFDPRGLLELLERLGALRPEGAGPIEALLAYLKSHPSLEVRRRNILEAIARTGIPPPPLTGSGPAPSAAPRTPSGERAPPPGCSSAT